MVRRSHSYRGKSIIVFLYHSFYMPQNQPSDSSFLPLLSQKDIKAADKGVKEKEAGAGGALGSKTAASGAGGLTSKWLGAASKTKKEEDWWTGSEYKGKKYGSLSSAPNKVVTEEKAPDALPCLKSTWERPSLNGSASEGGKCKACAFGHAAAAASSSPSISTTTATATTASCRSVATPAATKASAVDTSTSSISSSTGGGGGAGGGGGGSTTEKVLVNNPPETAADKP